MLNMHGCSDLTKLLTLNMPYCADYLLYLLE